MESFNVSWSDVPGWFSWPSIYDQAIAGAPANALFVDVGTFCGRSAIYLAQKIAASGKEIKVEAVYDHTRSFGLSANAVRAFLGITGVADKVTLRSGRPAAMATCYEDESIDMIYFDGDHAYEAVVEMINAYLPKVKSGGIIAGDDYTSKWPGVIQAVNELLPGAEIIPVTDGLTPPTTGVTYRWIKP